MPIQEPKQCTEIHGEMVPETNLCFLQSKKGRGVGGAKITHPPQAGVVMQLSNIQSLFSYLRFLPQNKVLFGPQIPQCHFQKFC
jgi:hypothetical protein